MEVRKNASNNSTQYALENIVYILLCVFCTRIVLRVLCPIQLLLSYCVHQNFSVEIPARFEYSGNIRNSKVWIPYKTNLWLLISIIKYVLKCKYLAS